MKKFFICLIAFFVWPFFIYGQNLISFDEAIQNCARYLQDRLPKNSRVALLVVQSENPELGELVLNRLSATIVNGNYLRVVERNAAALEKINQEMARHLSAQVSQETELQIGRQLGAEIIVTGSFSRIGQNWRFEIQATNIESTERVGHIMQENIRSESSWNSLASNVQGKPGESAFFNGTWTATIEYNNSFDIYQISIAANGRCTVKLSNDNVEQEADGNWSYEANTFKLNAVFRNAKITYQRNLQWVSAVNFGGGNNSFSILAKPAANSQNIRFTFFRD